MSEEDAGTPAAAPAAFPKSLGACIDKLYALRAERLKLKAKADAIGSQEQALRLHLVATLGKDDLEGGRGKLASASINRSVVADVKDWLKLYAFIKKTNGFDLLQRRVTDAAYRERLGEFDLHKGATKAQLTLVPGVEPFTVVSLNLNKL